MLLPINGVSPNVTSPYGDTNRPVGSTNPHRGVDFNYFGGQYAKQLNRSYPALRSPVSGIVTNAGEGDYGTIAIRDANGYSHEILHTHTRHIAVGDPVAAGQLIGTMGNTGVEKRNVEKGASHVHYQLKDPSGKAIDPSAFWDRQRPVDPNPAPPAYLGEQQQYSRDRNTIANSSFGNVPDAGLIYEPQAVEEPQPLVLSPPRSVDPKNIRVLTGRIAGQSAPQRFNPTAAAMLPNEFPVANGPASFGDRFGNWTSSTGVAAPLAPYQLLSPSPQAQTAIGIVGGKPMPYYPFPPPIFGLSDPSETPGEEDWSGPRLRRADWKGQGK